MKFLELAAILPNAIKLNTYLNPEISGIEQDSRKVKTGSLFVCIEGHQFDGHLFAKEAVERGAVAIVAGKELDVPVPVLMVKDTTKAMAVLADTFYGQPSHDLFLIGITGTNGKTSISHMVWHVFQKAGKKAGLIGSLYGKIGNETIPTQNTTPDSLTLQKIFQQMVDAKVEVTSMEVSSHALEQGRVLGTDFNVAVFSNLSQDHLDYHGTMEHYREAKGLLFSRLGNIYQKEKPQYSILNADDPISEYFRKLTASHILTYGIENEANVMAKDLRFGRNQTRFRLLTTKGEQIVYLPIAGLFNVYNALAAISVCLAYGLDPNTILYGLSTFSGVPGRFELVDEKQPFTVIVDYAHTPDGLENVLKTARRMAKKRLFVVVGCGGDRDRSKRPLMAQVACRNATDPIFTADNPRSEDVRMILQDMEAGVQGEKYLIIPDRKSAIEHAVFSAGEEDVILIAGKGHETYQIIGDSKIEFDDRIVAREAIRKRYRHLS